MRARNPRYASLVEPPVAELATIQRELLDRDTALVEYALGEERSYVWVVDAASLTAHELPPRARIEALARRAHDALSRAQAPDLRVALQELSDAIVTPLGARIAGKRLAIVTEGTLQYIPFAALPDAGGRPLIASHEIVSLPSASTLRALRRRRATARREPLRLRGRRSGVRRQGSARSPRRGAGRRAGDRARAIRARLRCRRSRAAAVHATRGRCDRVARAGRSRPEAAGLRRQPRSHHQRRSVRVPASCTSRRTDC